MIKPALNHPEVIVTAVASRDPTKGQKYATKHNIPTVYTSYQGIYFLDRISLAWDCTAIK
jgi:predicted dehydrogenase